MAQLVERLARKEIQSKTSKALTWTLRDFAKKNANHS